MLNGKALKYQKKPIVIEAMIWDGKSHRPMYDFLGGDPNEYMRPSNENFLIKSGDLYIKTSEGDMRANVGDYIIKEPFDEERKYYPCKPEIFNLSYEIYENDSKQ